MSKNTYLPLILTEVGYEKQTEYTTCGLSDTFQTMGRQSDFHPNYKWVMCNLPLLFFSFFFLFFFFCILHFDSDFWVDGRVDLVKFMLS